MAYPKLAFTRYFKNLRVKRTGLGLVAFSLAPPVISLHLQNSIGEKMLHTVEKYDQRVLKLGQFACLSVAVGASLISAGIAVLVGMQRSDITAEQAIFAGVGCLGVFGSHLLLPLSRNRHMSTRTLGWVLWILCTAFVGYSHATFFISAQDRAELRRSEQFEASNVPRSKEPSRELSDALTELAKVQGNLAALGLSTCQVECLKKQAKAAVLNGKIKAIEAEAEEIRNWRTDKADHLSAMAAQKVDPINQRISRVFELQSSTVGLATALLFSLMLEAVACYCWFLLLTRSDVSVIHESSAVTADVTRPDLGDLDRHVALVRTEIQAGRLNCSVKSIREFLGCAQARAREVRKLIEPKLITTQV